MIELLPASDSVERILTASRKWCVPVVTDVVQIVGVIGVILSLLVLAWQTRQLTQQSKLSNALGILQAHNSSMERHHASWMLLVEDPQLRPYFYDGKPCGADDPNRPKLLMIAEMVADAAEYGLIATDIVPGSRKFGGWQAYAPFIGSQPIVREVVSQHPGWFPLLALALGVTRTMRGRPVSEEGLHAPSTRAPL